MKKKISDLKGKKILVFKAIVLIVLVIISVFVSVTIFTTNNNILSLQTQKFNDDLIAKTQTINLCFSLKLDKNNDQLKELNNYKQVCDWLAEYAKLNNIDRIYSVTKTIGEFYYELDSAFSLELVENVDYFKKGAPVNMQENREIVRVLDRIYEKELDSAVLEMKSGDDIKTIALAPNINPDTKQITGVYISEAINQNTKQINSQLVLYNAVAIIISIFYLVCLISAIFYIRKIKHYKDNVDIEKLQQDKGNL